MRANRYSIRKICPIDFFEDDKCNLFSKIEIFIHFFIIEKLVARLCLKMRFYTENNARNVEKSGFKIFSTTRVG